MPRISIIGGGLAGCECAHRLAALGHSAILYERRPVKPSPAHRTPHLAELVCSNSLKSDDPNTSQGLLKRELERLGSLIMSVARSASVPAGSALAVDRDAFARGVESEIQALDGVAVVREEVSLLPSGPAVIATGPLTDGAFAASVARATGRASLHFYDAVAPIVLRDGIDMSRAFFASRYGKGSGEYLNLPLTKPEYLELRSILLTAERVIPRKFDKADTFPGCLPIEVMAERGPDCMRFGPLRPVGIVDPATGRRPYAVVQLRKEDRYDRLYNMVGFQTNLKFGEQERAFRSIPALRRAEFARYGVMHRNTFIDSPRLLNPDLSLKSSPDLFFAGQITGAEGYLESAALGLVSAIYVDNRLRGRKFSAFPVETMIGSLVRYITEAGSRFQPMHVSYSLTPDLPDPARDKLARRAQYASRSLEKLDEYISASIGP